MKGKIIILSCLFCVLSINNYITVAMLVPVQNVPRCFILGFGRSVQYSDDVVGLRHDVDIQPRSELAS